MHHSKSLTCEALADNDQYTYKMSMAIFVSKSNKIYQ